PRYKFGRRHRTCSPQVTTRPPSYKSGRAHRTRSPRVTTRPPSYKFGRRHRTGSPQVTTRPPSYNIGRWIGWSLLGEQGVDELVGVEVDQVGGGLAETDELDRDAELG